MNTSRDFLPGIIYIPRSGQITHTSHISITQDNSKIYLTALNFGFSLNFKA